MGADETIEVPGSSKPLRNIVQDKTYGARAGLFKWKLLEMKYVKIIYKSF